MCCVVVCVGWYVGCCGIVGGLCVGLVGGWCVGCEFCWVVVVDM